MPAAGRTIEYQSILLRTATHVRGGRGNRRSVLGDAANGPIFRAVATLCVTIVGLLSAVVLVQTAAGWL